MKLVVSHANAHVCSDAQLLEWFTYSKCCSKLCATMVTNTGPLAGPWDLLCEIKRDTWGKTISRAAPTLWPLLSEGPACEEGQNLSQWMSERRILDILLSATQCLQKTTPIHTGVHTRSRGAALQVGQGLIDHPTQELLFLSSQKQMSLFAVSTKSLALYLFCFVFKLIWERKRVLGSEGEREC